MDRFQDLIRHALNDDQPTVLAQVVQVQGSAYRKEGTSMLISRDGSKMGMISGGCLESDVMIRAEELFQTGKAEIYEYDLSSEDDLGWGAGAGCNGVISVFVRDIDSRFREQLASINAILRQKRPVLFFQSLDCHDHYGYVAEMQPADFSGTPEFTEIYRDLLNNGLPFTAMSKIYHFKEERLFIQIIWPKQELYLAGAGEDSRFLASLANQLGFSVHILDWRSAFCSRDFFPFAKSLQIGEIDQIIRQLHLDIFDSLIIMTHDFQRDRKILKAVKDAQLNYVGILGSRKRTERLLDGDIPQWLHSPIGLSIGADGPEEIAVSIMAEIISKRGKRL